MYQTIIKKEELYLTMAVRWKWGSTHFESFGALEHVQSKNLMWITDNDNVYVWSIIISIKHQGTCFFFLGGGAYRRYLNAYGTPQSEHCIRPHTDMMKKILRVLDVSFFFFFRYVCCHCKILSCFIFYLLKKYGKSEKWYEYEVLTLKTNGSSMVLRIVKGPYVF